MSGRGVLDERKSKLMREEELLRVWLAWNDPGINPEYHHRMQNRLRSEWPVLAESLDQLRMERDSREQ